MPILSLSLNTMCPPASPPTPPPITIITNPLSPTHPSQKQGLEATGQLANVSKTAGFGSVSALLAKNPNAKALALAAPKPKDAAEGAEGAGGAPKKEAQQQQRQQRKRLAERELQDESELGDRPCPMPVSAAAPLNRLSLRLAGWRPSALPCPWEENRGGESVGSPALLLPVRQRRSFLPAAGAAQGAAGGWVWGVCEGGWGWGWGGSSGGRTTGATSQLALPCAAST
jgi:hypothetical protein